MHYCDVNYRTKNALKEAVAAGRRVTIYPTEFGKPAIKDGTVAVGGPHFPDPHRWYAQVTIKDGVVVEVK